MGWKPFRSVQQAFSRPIEQLVSSTKQVFTDPAHAKLGDFVSAINPLGAMIVSDIKHPQDFAVQAAVAGGFAAGVTALAPNSAFAAGGSTAALPGTSSAAYSGRINPGMHGYEGGVPKQPGFFDRLAEGLRGGGTKVVEALNPRGLGSRILDGSTGLLSTGTKALESYLLYNLLNQGQRPQGTEPGSSSGYEVSVSVPQSLGGSRDGGFIERFFGGPGGSVSGDNATQPIEAGWSPLTIVLLVGAALGVLYFFNKGGK